jgi:hypothetical protein
MNTHPEAVKARFDAQAEMLFVIEAMLDGDGADAETHLARWKDRRRYARHIEKPELATTTVTADTEEAANLRSLLAECYERLQYREHCGGLPYDVEFRVVRALSLPRLSEKSLAAREATP